MSLNFPSSPTPGQVYTSEGISFIFDGGVWALLTRPFPWADADDGVAADRSDLISTPLSLDGTLDTFGPPPAPTIHKPVNLTASRAVNVAYQNTLDYPLLVTVIIAATTATTGFLNIGPATPIVIPPALRYAVATLHSTSYRWTLNGIVPPGWYYDLTRSNTGVFIDRWFEYRG